MIAKHKQPSKEELIKLALSVIEGLSNGLYLKDMLPTTGDLTMLMYGVMDEIPELREQYLRAQQIRAEKFADEIIHIADNEENWVKSRNQIDVRKWYSTKILPQKYGEKIQIDSHHQIPIAEILAQAQARLLPASYLPTASESKVVDIPPLPDSQVTDLESVDDDKLAENSNNPPKNDSGDIFD